MCFCGSKLSAYYRCFRCGQTAGLDAFSLGNVIKQAGVFFVGGGAAYSQHTSRIEADVEYMFFFQ